MSKKLHLLASLMRSPRNLVPVSDGRRRSHDEHLRRQLRTELHGLFLRQFRHCGDSFAQVPQPHAHLDVVKVIEPRRRKNDETPEREPSLLRNLRKRICVQTEDFLPQFRAFPCARADPRGERGGDLLDEHEGQLREGKRLSRLHGGAAWNESWNKRCNGEMLRYGEKNSSDVVQGFSISLGLSNSQQIQ